jgi:hypothetical protein
MGCIRVYHTTLVYMPSCPASCLPTLLVCLLHAPCLQSGYRRIARCVGHSSTVTHLDWSVDSSVIQSNDQAYEVGWGQGWGCVGGSI